MGHGRADDIVKIEGKRVSLKEVETALGQLDMVKAAAVVILPGEQARLAAAIEPNAPGRVRLAELGTFRFGQYLRRQLAERLDSVCLPKHWRFVTALPAAALGKRRAADILALFNEEDVSNKPDRPDEPEMREMRAIDSGIELDLFIPPELQQLEGHFPGLPIIPGVALVDWAARYAAQYLHLGDGVARSLQVKFRRIMQPGKQVTLTLKHMPRRDRLAFTYRIQDEILTSGNFAFSP